MPLIAALANGLYPIGDFVLEFANALRFCHCFVRENAFTFVCHIIFSGTRNFFATLSASLSNLCLSRSLLPAKCSIELIVDTTDDDFGATSVELYFVRRIS